MNTNPREVLGSVALLQHVEPQTLEAFLARALARDLEQGEVLFEEGEPGKFMFIVIRGGLDAFKRDPQRGNVLLRTLGPGEVGGLTSVSLGESRSATLRARQATTVLTVAPHDFRELIRDHPDLAGSVMATLSAKVRGKTRALASLIEQDQAYRFRIAFFDAKPYERASFEPLLGEDVSVTWIDAHLSPQTSILAAHHQAVCAFVNDDLRADTLKHLADAGVGLIAMRCAGYNNVDLETAANLELSVVRVPAYSPHAVAEHALALLMTLNRKTHRAANRVREGNFSLVGLVGFDLYGRTAGVVGLGKIGQCCAQIFKGLGMTVLGFDTAPPHEFARETGIELVDLDALLRRSDVVSLHVPLLPATHHLINAARLALMKPGAVLINTSRGGLVDTAALIDALKTGQVGAAGLDVYEEEGDYFFEDRSDRVIGDDTLARLMTFNNVLITSHQGFLTGEALANIAETTLHSVREFASGKRGADLTYRVR